MEAVRKLAEARAGLDFLKAKIDARRAEFSASLAGDLDALAFAQREVDEYTNEVKAEALAEFEANGTKKFDGCEVKVFTKLDYPEADAFAWAKESGLALTLDKKAFEKIAKATPLPFVVEVQEPKVTIASDLSAFIEA